MIRYALACDHGHDFESWFPSSASFDAQAARGLVSCPVCGSSKVGKTLMAPQVARKDRAEPASAPMPPAEAAPAEATGPVAMLSPQDQELRAKLKALRDHLIAQSDPVGDRFADEARKMHFGEIEHRTIHGVATPEEARSLMEDGVPFHPLPALPDERN